MRFIRVGLSALVCAIFLGLLPVPGRAQQKTTAPSDFTAWPVLSDAEREQKAALVEKNAGAEVLQWRVHVVDEFLGDGRSFQRVFYHYIRLKIFEDSGKKAATIDLPYRAPGGIIDISGRTIKPDGSIVELDRKAVYQRNLERLGGTKESVVSFAMPAVEKGAILEYRWKQTEDDNRFRYVRLHFQRDLPVQKVTYFVKPLDSQFVIGEELFLAPFNCKPSPVKREIDGYASTTLENVPAARAEAFSPFEANVRPWALLYYRQGGLKDPNKYWDEQGKQMYKEFKETLKSDGETKAAAANAVGSAADESAKLAALTVYVRSAVRNVNDPKIAAAEREAFYQKLPKDHRRSSTEVLRSSMGTSREINLVFAALATQAGFDVRPARVASKGEVYFSPKMAETYFLDNNATAVRSGNDWKIIDASANGVAPGMVPWMEEGMMALVEDPKAPVFVSAPYAAAEASAETRTANLELSRDGSLAGDVTEIFSGHRAEDFRGQNEGKLDAQRQEALRDRVTRVFPDAEVTAIQFENAEDTTKALAIRYHLDAPRFAQVTGKRILLQPNAFRRGQVSPFSAEQRTNPIEFPYAWQEADDVTIRLPDGFALDNADAPGGLNFGKPGKYATKISTIKSQHTDLNYVRTLTFGSEGLVSFDPSAYPSLKKAFAFVQVADTHTVALKEN